MIFLSSCPRGHEVSPDSCVHVDVSNSLVKPSNYVEVIQFLTWPQLERRFAIQFLIKCDMKFSNATPTMYQSNSIKCHQKIFNSVHWGISKDLYSASVHCTHLNFPKRLSSRSSTIWSLSLGLAKFFIFSFLWIERFISAVIMRQDSQVTASHSPLVCL